MPDLPMAKDFVPELMAALHHTYHDNFPGEPHDENDVMEYSRGFMYGVRFAVEYRKWARIIHQIAFMEEHQRGLNPPIGTDSIAMWMSMRFGPPPLDANDMLLKFRALRDLPIEEGTRGTPQFVNGELVWDNEPIPPQEWYDEDSWRGT